MPDTNTVDLNAEAAKLRKEAGERLCRMFGIAEGESDGEVERIVECIICAAMLTVGAVQKEAMSKETSG